MLTVPEAEASMREFLEERVENLKRSFEGDHAEPRATLAVSSILGLTIARHFPKLRALENISQVRQSEIVIWFGGRRVAQSSARRCGGVVRWVSAIFGMP
jgi:hypothetical protein